MTDSSPAPRTDPLPRTGRPWRPVVVFDLDGTLVDTIDLILASYQHAFRTVLGQEQDEQLIRGWIGQPLIRNMREQWPERADELFATYVSWNRAHTAELIRSYAGVTDVLADLAAAGVQVAVATSKLREAAQVCADLVGVTAHMQVLIALEDTEEHKPHPAPLLAALARLGARPDGAVYVGDAVVDVEAAQAAGMRSVAVTWGAASRADLEAARPDRLVDSAQQLREALLPEGLDPS
ncbi:MAG: HAD-IA family hydrolase [Actinomycetota bacterium]|nr:HAD-IA family hydrolase [Actinomycetota bacterium]